MKQFKMRVIAFIFALITSVIGVIAADNYTNELTGISFEPVSNSAINIVVKTRNAYSGQIIPRKQDENTYVIMLPNTSSSAANPDLSDFPDISKVTVRTMPYTQSGNGYTRITVKTNSSVRILGKNEIMRTRRPLSDSDKSNVSSRTTERQRRAAESRTAAQSSSQANNSADRSKYSETPKKANTAVNKNMQKPQPIVNEEPAQVNNSLPDEQNNTGEKLILVLVGILVIAIAVLSYMKAKDKLTEIAGERLDIEVDEDADKQEKERKDKEKKKKAKKVSIQNQIKSFDEKYSNPVSMPVVSDYDAPQPTMNAEKSTDDMNIVDLDELFNEHKNQENDALDDFLSSYDFGDEEDNTPQEPEVPPFDDDLYNRILKSKNIKFNPKDLECIEKILSVEISDETLNNIDQYAAAKPVQKSQKQRLEDLVADYSISQNIKFSEEDIQAMDKIMNVELDADFVTDLRTDSKRTKEMETEIWARNQEYKKPSEIVMLKVSDLLPDLSDVLANPEKYAEPEPEKAVADESKLLKNIENVSFKPFDDGTRDFEVLNDFDDKEEVIELYSEDFVEKKHKTDMPAKPAIKRPEERPVVKKPEASPIPKRPEARPMHRRPEVRPAERIQEAKPVNNTSEARHQNVIKCILEGKSYTILSSVELSGNIGCHLAKNESGYTILGYVGDNLTALKHYDDLKSEKIQARVTDKPDEETLRYIIRIGLNKFMVDIKDNCIIYVMDL